MGGRHSENSDLSLVRQPAGSGELSGHKINNVGCIFRIFVFVKLAAVITINKQINGTFKRIRTPRKTS
jgi:hypothetical protein